MITEEQYADKMRRISVLLDKGINTLTKEEEEELDTLSDEVEEYENDRYPLPMSETDHLNSSSKNKERLEEALKRANK